MNTDVKNDINEVWSIYLNLLESKKRGIKSFLNSPATIFQIEEIENKMELSFPSELRDLYLINNGQVSCNKFEGFFYGLRFITLDELYDTWLLHYSLCKGKTEEDMAKLYGTYKCYPENTVKTCYVNKNWIPFAADTCGNYIGIDSDPDVEGVKGQIIIYGRDETERVVVSHKLIDYIALMIEELKKGNYRFEKIKRFSAEGDKIIFSFKEDKHPNDVLKKLVKNHR